MNSAPEANAILAACSDDQLIEAINAGHVEDGLAVLQARYGAKVRQFIKGIVRDAWLAQDVAQETLMKVFFKSNLYQLGTSFKAWLFEIARNQALSALRNRRRSPRPVTSLNFIDPDSELDLLDQVFCDGDNRDLEAEEFMTAFEAAVCALPEHYQSVFRRCVMQGRTYRDVAEELDIPTGTVAIRIMRARKRLYKALSPHLDRIRRPPACIQ